MTKNIKRIFSCLMIACAFTLVNPIPQTINTIYATNADNDSDDPFSMVKPKEDSSGAEFSLAEDQNYFTSDDFDFAVEIPTSTEDGMRRVLELFFTVLEGAGAVAFLFGLGKMFLSFKDDKPDEKVQATMIITAGILVVTLPTIIENILKTV